MKIKKALFPALALLILFSVTPVMAEPPTRFTFFEATGTFATVSIEKEWITEGNILIRRGVLAVGSLSGGISGVFWVYGDLWLDLDTGRGGTRGNFTIEVSGGGTFEGSFRAITYDFGASASGTIIGRGTGPLEGQRIRGSYEAHGGTPYNTVTIAGILYA